MIQLDQRQTGRESARLAGPRHSRSDSVGEGGREGVASDPERGSRTGVRFLSRHFCRTSVRESSVICLLPTFLLWLDEGKNKFKK